MRLVFLHGLPGVGKLTVGRELAALTGYPLFHNHLTVDLVTTLFEFGTPEFVELREHIWLEAFGRASSSDLEGLIFTFASEATVPEGFASRALDVVRARGGDVIFVELDCDLDEVRRRVEHPDRQRFGKLASAAFFDQLLDDGVIGRLSLPDDVTSFSVDVTKISPGDAARAIAAQLD